MVGGDPWGTGETMQWNGKTLTNSGGGWRDSTGRDWSGEMTGSAQAGYQTDTLHNATLRAKGKISEEEERRRNQLALDRQNRSYDEGSDRILSIPEVQARGRQNFRIAQEAGMNPVQAVNGRRPDAPQAQPAPQQQQGWTNQASSSPQSMAQQYGWGAGLGGQQQPQQSTQQQQWGMQPWGGQQPQQAMPQWGQPQPQQQQMPQWSQPAYQTPPSGGRGVGQMGVSGGPMPQWGGAPQQQAMPQWGDFMQQMGGGPMAGMEAARMGGGAMQQMGGGSPWASMWGDPFAGREMATDPSSPAMGGLPQMDPTQQLLMQMMGGGGGLSGGFGAGGGSSGGGGASGGGEGAYQTPPRGGKGVGQTGVTGGDDPYGSLASILALFAGGGGGGGGGGAPAPTHYGGLPRNGLYYADLLRGVGG